ncbi:MAG TPA: dihydrofolate reductase family protein [Gemmatimonadales bacterium]|nr:dihydrofolate reductase family protein [Gemmatimonadales bacterium]
MAKLRINCFTISLDGFGAGPDQTRNEPLGVGGESLHEWMFVTEAWKDRNAGTTPADNFLRRGFDNVGAWIMGRNMFGPIRGDWPDEAWRGWWGRNPPYHCPTYVLTHYPRKPIEMEGGTVFHFVTDGIESAYRQAMAAAGGKDVRLGGGASVIRQYLEAGLVDQMHIAIAPILLGRGEAPFAGVDLLALGFQPTEVVPTPLATHYVLTRKS